MEERHARPRLDLDNQRGWFATLSMRLSAAGLLSAATPVSAEKFLSAHAAVYNAFNVQTPSRLSPNAPARFALSR